MSNKNYNPEIMPSFNVPFYWHQIFNTLSNYEIATLIHWCGWYCFENKQPIIEKESRLSSIWYDTIVPQLDKQFERWEQYVNNKSQSNENN